MIRSLAAGVLLAASALLPTTPASAAPAVPRAVVPVDAVPAADTPVSINGQLRVCGTKLCNQHGQPVQLRGMSTHGIQWYSQCVKTASLDALAYDWNADILRISLYVQEGGYETDPRRFTDMVHNYIEEATRRGMYALVDWHQLDPGDPNYNLSRARTFFTEIADRHKNKNNIIYDIANEPNNVSWAGIKSYAEQMVPVIRAKDPDGVIFVGTHGWASLGVSDGRSETDIVNNPVNASNLMYTFHFYAASHKQEYFDALSRAADKIPLFVTEFGTQTYTGDGGNDFTWSQKYLDFLASKKIGWTNWNFSDDFRSGAVFKQNVCAGNTFTGTSVLKPAGVWVRDRIRTPDAFESPAGTIDVDTAAELKSALTSAKPGDTIKLADGTYIGNFKTTVAGTSSAPITLDGRGLTGANYDDSWIDVKGNNYVIENNTGKNTTNNGFETHTQQSGWGCGTVFRGNRSDLTGATGSGRYAFNITNYNASTCKVTIDRSNTVTGGRALTNPGIPVS
ncbi:cellulase family glycosylhydrolase [Kribbella sp. NPDC050470]|uniref:glycoside hydrolase family 5 protein n=1 Tax=unclassified Kribbella TaxID=2644121 RepID=UPI0037A43A81